MKRAIIFLLALVMIFSMTACANDKLGSNMVGSATGPSSDKTPGSSSNGGDYLETYKDLLAKGDEASKAELANYIFLPTQTVETDRYGRTYTYDFTWDAEGRPTKVIAAFQDMRRETVYSYGDGTFTYSQDGVLIEEYTLDAAGRIVHLKRHRSDGCINTTDYAYNDQGLLIQETVTIEGNDSPTVIVYTYDAQGRMIREDYGYNSDIGADVTVYTYDESGKLIKEHLTVPSDGNSYETVYTYNAQGQLVSEKRTKTKNGVTEDNYSKTYEYDDKGNVIGAVQILTEDSYTYKDEWTYDEYGNLIKAVCTSGQPDNLSTSIIEHKNYTVFYVPDQHAILEEILASFQPELD